MIADVDPEGAKRVAVEIGGECAHHWTDVTQAKKVKALVQRVVPQTTKAA